jgi:hypothetical protein
MKPCSNKFITTVCCASMALVAIIALSSCSMGTTTITAPRYALVYGVSTYNSSGVEGNYPNLTYSDDDAKSMADLMASQSWTVSERIKGLAVSGGQTAYLPTKAQMVADISALSSISSDSTVFIYFSGHGTIANNISYIVPYLGVSDSSSPTVDYTKCVSPSDLNSMLSVLPTKNVIVIFDTCNSGGFVSSSGATDSSPSDYSQMQSYSAFSTAMAKFGSLLVANASASGAKTPIVISAAGTNESSYDGTTAMAHGVFTYFLLKAASQGDSDGDGFVTTTEAYAYTAKYIKAWGAALTFADYFNYGYFPFLPHISGDTRDLVLFTK